MIMDSSTISEETKGLIVKALEGLANESWKTHDGEFPTFPEETFLSHTIDTGKARLIKLQTISLPALRQQLLGLIESFDLRTLDKDHKPKYPDVLEITHQLGPTLNLIDTSTESLSPAIGSEAMELLSKVDHDYGIVKRYRCVELRVRFHVLMTHNLRNLFGSYWEFVQRWNFVGPASSDSDHDLDMIRLRDSIIELTDESCQVIDDDIIKWSKRSDFAILQKTWQEQADDFSDTLNFMAQQIDYNVNFKKKPKEGAPRNNPRENIWGGYNGFDAPEDQAETDSEDDGSLPEFNLLNLELIPSIRSTIPLLKLGRIFFTKLLDTPKGKPPFSLSDRLSSYELEELKTTTISFRICIMQILHAIYEADDLAGLNSQRVDIMPLFDQGPPRALDRSLTLLAFFLVPKPSQLDLPLPENPFKEWFCEFRFTFSTALQQLRENLFTSDSERTYSPDEMF
ncbi:hypothetical protein PGTUg99_028617 [Puccinia graminis f. sp. tritici]|uniref:Uncharacterized protein n=1 Tax=Puccinia graminis f. sp. tritici TaxID=56615 RepID=A0A5B0LUX5_PUCGR|nr:hypothetical protein PGTUg99_028617 [Puccinia graminis f. sp. tritici]